MDIINASIPADLSVSAIEEGLKRINATNLNKICLLVSGDYSFNYIYSLLKNDKNYVLPIKIDKIDSSKVLEKESWMIIDYSTNVIYYNPKF